MGTARIKQRTVGAGLSDYKLGEVNTGERWINGQLIYCTIVDFGALPNATTKNVAHNISPIGQLVDLRGIAQAAGPTVRPLPYAPDPAGTVATGIQLSLTSTNVVIKTGADYSTSNGYVFVYYTKG
jgi:hypothetical protein